MFAKLTRKKQKSPAQLVTLTRTALTAMRESGGADEAAEAEIVKRVGQIKVLFYGEPGKEVNAAKVQEMATTMIQDETFVVLLESLSVLPFEVRKDVAQIFNNVMRHDHAGFAAYVGDTTNNTIMATLVEGYDSPDIALNCGSMLRECLRKEPLCRTFLYSDWIWVFFDRYVHMPNFDVASDAFATFKDALTRHKALSAEFLESQFDMVFERYETLLKSENYVTRRQSLKLLGELLLDRSNFNIMMRYISRKRNLKMMMNLLRDRSPNIQFEAFHVFKVFVANPNKPADVTQILLTNRDKLINYLNNFHNDREDGPFLEEKQLLVHTLQRLQPPAEPVEDSSSATAAGGEGSAAAGGAGGDGAAGASAGVDTPPPPPGTE